VNLAAFGPDGSGRGEFPPFGEIYFPYRKFGPNISSLDLFGNDEMDIFNFYWKNRKTYRNVVDIGANIGLHSLIMAKCGFDVWAFEPDADNRRSLCEVIAKNDARNVDVLPYAVSDKWGNIEFTSVKDNTTGSHITGAKPSPYGDYTKYLIKTWAILLIAHWAELIKLDAEGHEAVIIEGIKPGQWDTLDMIVEIHSMANAERIWLYAKEHKLNAFSMTGRPLKKMPSSPKLGHVFITRKDHV
jgi:FkbM family methyltransferase